MPLMAPPLLRGWKEGPESRPVGALFSEVRALTSKIEQYAKDDAQIYDIVIGDWTVGGHTQQLRCPPK